MLKVAVTDSGSILGPTPKVNQGCLVLGNSAGVKAGQSVYALGYPLTGLLGGTINVSSGLINNTVGLGSDPRMFQISVPIQPGNSGSPLFDSQGRVVGVVTSTLNNEFLFKSQGALPQNVNFAIKISYLQNLLAMLPGGECEALTATGKKALDAVDISNQFSSRRPSRRV